MFLATEHTRGPWDPDSQHAGPPAALLARAIEACEPGIDDSGAEWRVGRVTFEILRAVPIAPLRVEARVVRPGRRVELLEGSLSDGEGEALVRARAWRVALGAVDLPQLPATGVASPPGPEEGERKPFFPTAAERGYHAAMEYRFISGGFLEPGPAVVWMRMRIPLVAGEDPSPLARVLTVADSANGVSASLDWSRFLFINVDLSVHLHRLPAGEWVCLDALTLPEPSGIGLSEARLHDELGPLGRVAQTLLVAERG